MTDYGIAIDFDSIYSELEGGYYACLQPLRCGHACKKHEGHPEPCGLGNCPFMRYMIRRCGHGTYRPCMGMKRWSRLACTFQCSIPNAGLPCEEVCCDCGFITCTIEQGLENYPLTDDVSIIVKPLLPSPLLAIDRAAHSNSRWTNRDVAPYELAQKDITHWLHYWKENTRSSTVRYSQVKVIGPYEYANSSWERNEPISATTLELLSQYEDILDIDVDYSILENLIYLPDQKIQMGTRKTYRNPAPNKITKKEIQKPSYNFTDLGFNVFVETELLSAIVEQMELETELQLNNRSTEHDAVQETKNIPEPKEIAVLEENGGRAEAAHVLPSELDLKVECQKIDAKITDVESVPVPIDLAKVKQEITVMENTMPDVKPVLLPSESSCIEVKVEPGLESEIPLTSRKGRRIRGCPIKFEELRRSERIRNNLLAVSAASQFSGRRRSRSPTMPRLNPQNYYYEIPPEYQRKMPPKLTPEIKIEWDDEIKPKPAKIAKIARSTASTSTSLKEPRKSSKRPHILQPSIDAAIFDTCLQVVRNILNSTRPNFRTGNEASRKHYQNMELLAFANFIQAKVVKQEEQLTQISNDIH